MTDTPDTPRPDADHAVVTSPLQSVNDTMMRRLRALLDGHGVRTVNRRQWLLHDASGTGWGAYVVPHGQTCQLDVLVALADGRLLIESFAGVGEDLEAQAADAFSEFADGALHVLLALVGQRGEDTEVTTIDVDGTTWQVLRGGIRGRLAQGASVPDESIDAWNAALDGLCAQAARMSDAPVHWARVFHAAHGDAKTTEVLLDGAPPAAMPEMSAVVLDARAGYASLREFAVVVRDKVDPVQWGQTSAARAREDGAHAPSQAEVDRAIDLSLTLDPRAPDPVRYAVMRNAGVPAGLAEQVLAFVPEACAHTVFQGAAKLPATYKVYTPEGEASYVLARAPVFARMMVRAMQLNPEIVTLTAARSASWAAAAEVAGEHPLSAVIPHLSLGPVAVVLDRFHLVP